MGLLLGDLYADCDTLVADYTEEGQRSKYYSDARIEEYNRCYGAFDRSGAVPQFWKLLGHRHLPESHV